MTSDREIRVFNTVRMFLPPLAVDLLFALRGFGIVLVGLFLLQGPFVQGDDDWDFKEPIKKPRAGMVIHNRAQLTDQQINQMIFNGQSASHIKQGLDYILTVHVASIERVAPLSDEQKNKLRLAGHSDVKELFLEVDEIKKKCEVMKKDLRWLNNVWPMVQPLQMKMRSNIFDDNSMFAKVIKRTLDSEQAAIYGQQEEERRQFRYKATIGLVTTMLENGIPFRDQQRQKFLEILSRETKPPNKFGQYDQFYVYYQAGKIKDKLRPIFDEAQWKALSQMFRRGEGMEAHLRKQGILP